MIINVDRGDFKLNTKITDNISPEESYFCTSKPFDNLQVALATLLSKPRLKFRIEQTNNVATHVVGLAKSENSDKVFNESFMLDLKDLYTPINDESFKYGENLSGKVKNFTELSEYGTLYYKFGAESLKYLIALLIGKNVNGESDSVSFHHPERLLYLTQIYNATVKAHEDFFNERFPDMYKDIENASKIIFYPQYLILKLNHIYEKYKETEQSENTYPVIPQEIGINIIIHCMYYLTLGITLRLVDTNLIDEEVFFNINTLKANSTNILQQLINSSEITAETKKRYLTLLYIFPEIYNFYSFYDVDVEFINPLTNIIMAMGTAAREIDFEDEDKERYLDMGILNYKGMLNLNATNISSILSIDDPVNNFFTFFSNLMDLESDSKPDIVLAGAPVFKDYDKTIYNNYNKLFEIRKDDITNEAYVNGLYDFLINALPEKVTGKVDIRILHALNILSFIFRKMLSTSKNVNNLRKNDVYEKVINGLWYAESMFLYLTMEWFLSNSSYMFEDYILEKFKGESYNTIKTLCRSKAFDLARSFCVYCGAFEENLKKIDFYNDDPNEISQIHKLIYQKKYPLHFYAVVPNFNARDKNSIFAITDYIDNLNETDKNAVLEFVKKLPVPGLHVPSMSESHLCRMVYGNCKIFYDREVNISENENVNIMTTLMFLVSFNLGFAKSVLGDSIANTVKLGQTKELESKFIDITEESLISSIYSEKKFSF